MKQTQIVVLLLALLSLGAPALGQVPVLPELPSNYPTRTVDIQLPKGGSFWTIYEECLCDPGVEVHGNVWLQMIRLNKDHLDIKVGSNGDPYWIVRDGLTQVVVPAGCVLRSQTEQIRPVFQPTDPDVTPDYDNRFIGQSNLYPTFNDYPDHYPQFPVVSFLLFLAAIAAVLLAVLLLLRRNRHNREALRANTHHPALQGPDCRRGIRRWLPFLGTTTKEALRQADEQLSELNQARRSRGLPPIEGVKAQIVGVEAVARGNVMVPVEYGDGTVRDASFRGERLRLVVYRQIDGEGQLGAISAVTETVDACDNGVIWNQSTREQAQRAAQQLVFRNPMERWRDSRFLGAFDFVEIETFLRGRHVEIVTPPAPQQPQPAPAVTANEDNEVLGFVLAALQTGEVRMSADHFSRLARVAAHRGFLFVVSEAGNGQVTLRGVQQEPEEVTNVTALPGQRPTANEA